MDLKRLNHYGQELNKITKKLSDLNAVNELINGNPNPAKRKIKNKVKNKGFNLLKKLL